MSKAKHDGMFVLGCPRSGTTLIRRLLDAHPQIAAPGETYLFTACARFLHSDRSVDSMNVGVLNGLGFAGFDSQQILDRLRDFAFTFRREHAVREGKTRWAEKTAVDAFHVEELSRLCGDHAYFICVTRHGLDVACSMNDWCAKSQSYPSEIHAYIQKFPRPLVAFCHAWVDATNAIRNFAKQHPENAILIRYEDLIADPEDTMRQVVEFVGETWQPGTIAAALHDREPKGFSDWKTFSKSEIDKSGVNRWQELTAATVADLASIVNSTLVKCGYDPVEVKADDSDEKARRRYELGLALQKTKQ